MLAASHTPQNLAAWIDRGLLLAVLLACGCSLSLNVADPDLWGHIQYGRDCWRNGLPATTTYSYIAEGYRWVNHELVAEFALFAINDTLGGRGLLIVKALLGWLVIGLIMRAAWKQGASLITVSGTALLVAVTLGNHWSLRPQLASYTCFALQIALLGWAFQGWEGDNRLNGPWLRNLLARFGLAGCLSWISQSSDGNEPQEIPYSRAHLKALWLIVPLMVVWTNSHGGFLAGLCVFIAYLGLRGVEVVAHRGFAAWGLLLRFGLMIVAAAVSTLINPYGTEFLTWLYDDLKVPRPEIVEWRAPDFFSLETLPFVILLAAWVGALLFSKKRHDFTQQVILALLCWQSMSHLRHIAFFAIACGFWLPRHWQSIFERLGASSSETSLASGLSPRLAPILAGLMFVACLITGGKLASRLHELKVERENFPLAAAEFIAREKLSGKMIVTFNWAQYALATFGPNDARPDGLLVHVDGRCRTSYSQAMLDEHFDFILGKQPPTDRYRDPNSGPFDPEKALRNHRPDLVLLARSQQPGCDVMLNQQATWCLLYQDELAQLWGRRSRFDDPANPDYVPESNRVIGSQPQTGYVAWPAMPAYFPTKIVDSAGLNIAAAASH
ncbi:hypothetical protein ETAA8_32290 [Anatilimnocola aggregata]|uniref:Uncharacterized protein n=1 Tax=Anatilimnocola aggregata TaxID=2528021 RepID=A0A517YD64_9BACT|nr:hypothetical protein [Anatilimnocola aggregata]QDU28129.1 hypothetical protein ETAA8_32290 [Anatilimnocola aggregata]